MTVKAYKKLAEMCDYPLHLGVTEAGATYRQYKILNWYRTTFNGGHRDTIRVSLSSDPVDEIKAGYEILKSLELIESKYYFLCPSYARQHFQ